MTTTGLTPDPREAELAACRAHIAELEEENDALNDLAVALVLLLNSLTEPIDETLH